MRIGILTKVFTAELVDAAIAKHDGDERRRRLLPAGLVVYLFLVLCLFAASVVRVMKRRLGVWKDGLITYGWYGACLTCRPAPYSVTGRVRIPRNSKATALASGGTWRRTSSSKGPGRGEMGQAPDARPRTGT
ncbi:transposase domain-containing protein [Streptomyces sp. NPDC006879]|uniref:transposase domain-containing protein n=1 Tax=Streptomyces sp. NPDC006879 TaxID=3364767 RepID=UPI0036B04635